MSALKVHKAPASTDSQQLCVVAQMLQLDEAEPLEFVVPPLVDPPLEAPPTVDEPPVSVRGGRYQRCPHNASVSVPVLSKASASLPD